MPDASINVRKITLSDGDHWIDAKALLDTNGNEKTYEDIIAMLPSQFTILVPWTIDDYTSTIAPSVAKLATIPYGVTVEYNNGLYSATGTMSASSSGANTHLYLIYHPHDSHDSYDEYVSTGSAWEKIGNTDIDLSSYATKDIAAKAGTYRTGTSTATATTASGGGTFTTTQESGYSAVGTAKMTFMMPVEAEEAGRATISGSNFGFSGDTATLSFSASVTGITIANHTLSIPSSISGSQTIGGHTHSISYTESASDKETFVKGIPNFNGGSFTQGSKASLSYTARANVMCSPTISSSGVLSWGLVACDDITSWSANGNDSFTAASLGSLSTGSAYAKMPTATAQSAGGHTVNFSNASLVLTTATLSHSVTGSGSVSGSITYKPTGSITGSATILPHTHSLATDEITITGTATVPISAHSHTITLSNHTHGIGDHAHDVTIPNCSGPLGNGEEGGGGAQAQNPTPSFSPGDPELGPTHTN